MCLLVKRLTDTAILPTRATNGSAGYDLYCDERTIKKIPYFDSCTFSTGICVEIPKGYVGLVIVRSSLGFKHSVRLSNCVGVIDSDYRGEIKVSLFNDGTYDYFVHPKDRIAQLLIVPYAELTVEEVSELTGTKRGTGGFGSTGR